MKNLLWAIAIAASVALGGWFGTMLGVFLFGGSVTSIFSFLSVVIASWVGINIGRGVGRKAATDEIILLK